MVISITIWFVFGLLISYLIVIGIITFGWFQLASNERPSYLKEVRLSVVIAVRNEEENISRLISQILNQDYPQPLFDIIIIDDHSTDNTASIIESYMVNDDHKISLLSATGNGKKNALREGIRRSTSDLIVTTDGDCEVGNRWLSGIVSYYCTTGKKVICGPVVYSDHKSIFQKFVTVDFASLVASGAGSLGVGLPLMGNGANIAFEKQVYDDFKDKSNKYASGDDVFLIHHSAKKYGYKSVGFIKQEEVIVKTPPPVGFADFMKQRIRWASKAKGYYLPWPIIVSLTIFIFNLALFTLLVGSIFFNWLLPIYFLIILTKFLIDIPLVFRFLTFSGKSKLKPWLFIMEFVYPVYIVISAISSFVFSFSWKDRRDLQ